MTREVSQGLWVSVLAEPTNDPTALALKRLLADVYPVQVGDPALPMEGVSWCDAARFANLWSIVDGRTPVIRQGADPTTGPQLLGCERGTGNATRTDLCADGIRLPTEAEWEVLARAGSDSPWPVPADAVDTIAWTAESAGWNSHPVGTLLPNAWSLHDMTGNLWEWTADTYEETPSGGQDVLVEADKPTARRVIRGGSFTFSARLARSAYRNWGLPQLRYHDLGFRLVRPPRPPPTEPGP